MHPTAGAQCGGVKWVPPPPPPGEDQYLTHGDASGSLPAPGGRSGGLGGVGGGSMGSKGQTGGTGVGEGGARLWPPTPEAARAGMGLGRGGRGSWGGGVGVPSLLLVDKRGSVWPEEVLLGRTRTVK